MNMPMRHLFGPTSPVQERPAPAVHEPPPSTPPGSPGRRITRLQLVAVLAVVAVIGAFGAFVLTQDNGSEPALQPAPAAFGDLSTVVATEANWAFGDAVAAPDGRLLFASRGVTNAITTVMPSGQVSRIAVAGTDLGPVAVGRDGTIWTSSVIDNATFIVKLGADGSSPQRIQVPSVDLGATGKRTVFPIHAMTVARDGTLWFQRGQINRWDSVGGYTSALGKVTRDGQVSMYPVADRLYAPGGMVEGPDGGIWFSATCVCARSGSLEKTSANPTLDENGKLVVQKYTVKTSASGATGIGPHPSRLLVVGSSLWFVEQQDDYATELTPPAPINGNGAIGRLPLDNPSNESIVEYQLPSMHSRPMGITLGGDGNLWVTEAGTSKLARFGTDGKLLGEYTVPGAPDEIVTGADGNLYFTTGGAFEWSAQTHTDGLVGNQFPAWNVPPSSVQRFLIKP